MKEYLEKYRSRIILMGLFVFLIHGAKLHSGIIGIDTEDIIHIQSDFYGGWLNTGRQGLYALKWLMDSLNFQPYMAGLMTLVFFTAAVSAFFLLWDKVLARKSTKVMPWVAGGLFFIAHPIIVEQFYFTLQSVEICIGLLLTVVSLYLIVRFCEAKGLWRLTLSSLILVLNFSVYQAFVVVFIFGAVSVLLAGSISKLQSGEEIAGRKLLKNLLPYLGVFLAAFSVNALITQSFFGSSDYLGGQILWGKFDVLDNFRAIAGHVVKVLTGYGQVHYHFSFGLLCLAAVCLVMLICIRYVVKGKKRKGAAIVVLFYLLSLLSTPFLMTLVCGGSPVIRSQLVLPLITGYLAYLSVSLLSGCVDTKRTWAKAAVAALTVVCATGIWWQTSTTMSLYYTDEVRYKQDEYLGRELITAIDEIQGNDNLPVAIVGTKPFSGNNACVIGEMIGKSFFDHDADIEPQYFWSTRRMLGFLHVLGADYNQAHPYRFGDVVNYSMGMPSWPQEGCVQIYDGMIVVKLSDV